MADNTQQQSNMADFARYVVRAPDGTIDLQKTHVKFSQDLSTFVASEQNDTKVIAEAVREVFSERQQKTLGMPALIHYTMEKLSVDPSNFNTIRDKVADYVRSNKRAFKIGKGKGGGVTWQEGNVAEAQAQVSAPPSSPSIPAPSPSTPPSYGSIRPRA